MKTNSVSYVNFVGLENIELKNCVPLTCNKRNQVHTVIDFLNIIHRPVFLI
jgi:hypothetical protein